VFLRTPFTAIAENYSYPLSWPGKSIIEQLTRTAVGLFVRADTVAKFVEQGFPNKRVENILQGRSHDEEERLDGLYHQVMKTYGFTKAPLTNSKFISWSWARL
jgi:hypothetical protein